MRRFMLLKVILLFIPIMMTAQRLVVKDRFDEKVNLAVSVNYRYIIQLPWEYDKMDQVPLIIFLHGSGERGDSIDLVKVHGPWHYAAEHPDFPFMIMAPQCKPEESWKPVELDLLLDAVISEYKVDTSRIYLTGLSRGGFGALDWSLYHPDRFAAVAPICGASNFHVLAANQIKSVPFWFFHGALDDVVPVEFSANLVRKLKTLGADVNLTIYPYAGHDSWTETYMNKELYTWFLIHQKTGN